MEFRALVIVHNRAGNGKIRIAFFKGRQFKIGFNIWIINIFETLIYAIPYLVVTTSLVVDFKHIPCFFRLWIC